MCSDETGTCYLDFDPDYEDDGLYEPDEEECGDTDDL